MRDFRLGLRTWGSTPRVPKRTVIRTWSGFWGLGHARVGAVPFERPWFLRDYETPSGVLLNFGRQGFEVEAQRPGPLTPPVQGWLGFLLSAQVVPGYLLSAWSFLTRSQRHVVSGG